MKPIFRIFAKSLLTAALTLLVLTSTTGCSPRYVVIPGEEMIQVEKTTLDTLYSDNERLLKALEICQEIAP